MKLKTYLFRHPTKEAVRVDAYTLTEAWNKLEAMVGDSTGYTVAEPN